MTKTMARQTDRAFSPGEWAIFYLASLFINPLRPLRSLREALCGYGPAALRNLRNLRIFQFRNLG
jgi:hypothetical protein